MLALKRILYESATCCNVKSTVIYFIRIIILRLVKEEMDSNKKYHTYIIYVVWWTTKFFCPIHWYELHLNSSFTDNSMIFTPQSCKHIDTRDPAVKK